MVDAECETHGVFNSESTYFDTGWMAPTCHQCLQERRDEHERKEAELNKIRRDEQWELMRGFYFDQAEIPLRYHGKDFDGFVTTGDKPLKALETCREYADNFSDYRKSGTSLILCGNAGSGKTHLGCAILSSVLEIAQSFCRYTTASRAFRTVKSTYRSDSNMSESAALRNFTTPALLVIDEIGVQFGSDTEKNILFDIINERYEAMLPTILISNLSLDGMKEYCGERVIDRMKENGGKLVVFDWDSHRGAKS